MHFSNFANAAGQIKLDEWAKLGKEYKVPTLLMRGGHSSRFASLDYANMGTT